MKKMDRKTSALDRKPILNRCEPEIMKFDEARTSFASGIALFLSALSLTMLFTSSCSYKTKKALGIASSGPNEYSVGKNKPLEMPPHFEIDEIESGK